MYTVPFLEKTGLFTSIDIQFAGFMAALSPRDDTAVAVAAALTSRHIRNGNVCFNLAAHAGGNIKTESDPPGNINCPDLKKWRNSLLKSDIVGKPGEYRPLILDDKNRLYLFRYWEYEKKLAEALVERAAQALPEIDATAVNKRLERLFPQEQDEQTSWTKVAAVVALLKRLCVISGGPGTGKTFAVARILAFLLEQHEDTGNELKIFLAAPTGKAASRLTESIARAREALPCTADIKNAIPSAGLTIHRLLKSKGQPSRFVYNENNRLPADVVVVDEASMVDLPLMSKLIQALSPATRLILLGDANQLASVEAGSVLGDICGENRTNRFSGDFLNKINSIYPVSTMGEPSSLLDSPGLHDCRVHFYKNYRFDEQSGIPELSQLVSQGRAEEVVKLVTEKKHADVRWLPLKPGESFFSLIEKKIVHHYDKLTWETDPVTALDGMNRFKILCALNHGPYGVSGINQMVFKALGSTSKGGRGSVDRHSLWYHGRPLLIRKNDYQLELFNGDMGIVMEDPHNRGELTAFFNSNNGELRRIPPYRLPAHETAYAMTIHKSQGSEFDEVLMVLPEKDTPILTRELLYTGITRARRNLSILSPESVIRLAVSRQIERTSGLRDLLAIPG